MIAVLRRYTPVQPKKRRTLLSLKEKCTALANCTQFFSLWSDEMMFSSKNQIKMFLIIFEKFKLRLSVDLWARGKSHGQKIKMPQAKSWKLHRHRAITSRGCSSKWFFSASVGWSISANICIFSIIIIMLERCNAQRRNK